MNTYVYTVTTLNYARNCFICSVWLKKWGFESRLDSSWFGTVVIEVLKILQFAVAFFSTHSVCAQYIQN